MSDISSEETRQNPWDSDLAERFEDEDTRNAVSEFLGEKVQPYVTKLEQESKPNRDATVLWEQFHEDPTETTVQVIRELYGDDKAKAFADSLIEGNEAPSNDDITTTETTQTEPVDQNIEFDKLPTEVQELVKKQQLEESRQQYYSELDRVKTDHADELPKDDEGNPKLNENLFHPFVVAAEGDFDKAFEGFQKFVSEASGELGTQTGDGDNTPPPTIDSKTRDASSTVPTQKTNQSFDDAMDDFLADLKTPPPTVGAV